MLLYSVLLGYCALFASKFPTLIPVKKNQRLAFVSLVWNSSILRTYLSLCTLGFHVLKRKVARALLAFCASACLPCRSQSFVVVHLCCVHTLLNTEDSSPCACVSRHRCWKQGWKCSYRRSVSVTSTPGRLDRNWGSE